MPNLVCYNYRRIPAVSFIKQIVESGTVSELLSRPQSRLAREMFPLGTPGVLEGRTVIDITFRGEETARPFISTLARTYNVDVNVLGAAVESVGGKQIGRMRISLDGAFENNVVPIGYLREQGLQVDLVEEAAAAAAESDTDAAEAGVALVGKEI